MQLLPQILRTIPFTQNSNVTIESGTFNLKSGDDGIHADTSTVINNGNIVIEKSYEGIEGSNVTINGGTIELTASDDGIKFRRWQ